MGRPVNVIGLCMPLSSLAIMLCLEASTPLTKEMIPVMTKADYLTREQDDVAVHNSNQGI